tara:strand:- start:2205 stop:2477 length:273 start_codon:yes stop_codon:yes gene_type:complete
MKTFSDVKRKLTKGTELKCVRNDHTDKYLNVTRKIDVVQTNAICFEGGSWLYFPKAKYVEILGDNAFSFVGGDFASQKGKTITYEFKEVA